MAHANARTTLYARKLIVARVRAGHRPGEVAKQLGISRQTVYKWIRRWRTDGQAGLADRSSRPHRMPCRTSPQTVARIIAARRCHHAAPMRLAAIVGVAASTIGAVLVRAGVPRLANIDRLTGELLGGRRHSDRRCEREHPGDLLHVDVMKLGWIPDGGGWRGHGRAATVDHRHKPVPIGFDYVRGDPQPLPAGLRRGPARRARGRLRRVPRSCGGLVRRPRRHHRLGADRQRAELPPRRRLDRRLHRARHRPPVHPARTSLDNGKAERFNRTLPTEWAYATGSTSNDQRTAAADSWLEHYNTARSHSALGDRPPICRLAA